jgi:hypothetical protein
VITSSARYSATNSTHTTTFNNFYHNNHKIEGTHVAKNLGLIDGVLTFNVKVQDGKVTAPTGEVVTYEQNSTRSWVAGTDSPLNIWDDEYELEGTQEGVSSKGVEYTMTVGEPLHVVVYPRAITSGTLEVKMEGLPTMLFNYEDNTITIGGQTYPLGT